ncbi:MAG: envelope stress response rane protein PspB [Rhodospirillales bacterium]|nr:envelope stress response rane protein PspB [Rhodospirillales bacterium]
MEFFLVPLVGTFLVIVLPIWIIAHYATRWRTSKVITNADEQLLSELWDTARKMEDRIRNLERILDEESPHWRERL